MPQTIFFDESGFTGNNLLNSEQTHFAYASIAIDDADAFALAQRLISDYRIDGAELKGKNLLRFHRGKKAVDDLLHSVGPRIKISLSEKKFALACKIFEHIFEPTFSNINSIFYMAGFHRFVANMLYVEFVAQSADAESLFAQFEDVMRKGDETGLASMFTARVDVLDPDFMRLVREFATSRITDIRREFDSVKQSGVRNWILELSQSSLLALLSAWGEQFDEITAICDNSKPLKETAEFFNTFVGKSDKIYTDIFTDRERFGCNLSEPLRFADSTQSAGIQLADVTAAATIFAFTNRTDEFASRWRQQLVGVAHYGSVLPNLCELEMASKAVQRNVILLRELHRRARAGTSLVDGMPQYVNWVSQQLRLAPISLPDQLVRTE